MANASLRLMLRDGIRIAAGGEAFITAEPLAGKKELAPRPLTMLPTTTSHRPVDRERWA